jgi:hemerythrin
MPLLEWDESFSVNINLIDRQHQKLFKIANQYHQAIKDGKSSAALNNLLDGLVDYVTVHFNTEERYFDRFNFEDSEAHKQEHRVLEAKIGDLKSKVKRGIKVEEKEISKLLLIWLQGHIKGTDHKFIKCFHENGFR